MIKALTRGLFIMLEEVMIKLTDEEVLQLFEDYVDKGYEILVSALKSETSGSGLRVN